MKIQKPMITADELVQRLDDSQDFMDKVTRGFAERNERILYRRPEVNSEGKMEYAELVDNTLASYLEKMPKNVIQKLPDFTLDAHSRDKAEDLTFEFLAKRRIMRHGTTRGYGLLQKNWIAMRNSATFGACAVYLPFLYENGDYTVGFEPIYWADLYPEAYASNINSANYVQFRTLKTKGDLEAILEGDALEQGSWDKTAIREVLEYGEGQNSGKIKQNTKAQMDGELPNNMFELFIYSDRDWLITWHYASGKILRAVPNLSKRKRVVGLYSDYDGSSIMGRSIVDMAYGSQQTLTALLRSFVYTVDYNTDPAKFVKGVNLDEERFNLTKGNTMFLQEEDGEVKLLPIDTTTLQNFPNLYQLLLGVMYKSLPASNESGLSLTHSGDPTYSRTQAGVNQQANKADIENNYYRKNYEQFFEMVLETQLNIYLAEMRAIYARSGINHKEKLDEEYANMVREIAPNAINELNEVVLDFDGVDNISVSVDFESTRALAKEEDLQRLNTFMTGFFEAAKSDPETGRAMRSVLPLLLEEMTKSSNLENSAKISETMKQALEEARIEAKQQKQIEMQQMQQAQDTQHADAKAPTVNIQFRDLPPAGKIQAAKIYGIELTPEDVGEQTMIENLDLINQQQGEQDV